MKFLVILFVLLCWYSANVVAESDENITNWAVLIAGSNFWYNYRHQADVCHSYQILIERGIPPEHIIVMMYDDIANNTYNPTPGQIFNEPNGTDVYAGVKIDYSGKDVTPENFLNVLKGNASGNEGKGNGRVLESTEMDNLFIYFSGHGDVHLICFPETQPDLHQEELIPALEYMHKNKMYKKMLFYLESCESGSMFEGLSADLNRDIFASKKQILVYAVTAADGTHSSWSTFCGEEAGFPGNCWADEFSASWMKDTETHDINTETVGTQFSDTKNGTASSTVCQFGDFNFRNDMVSLYQGRNVPKEPKYFDEELYNEALKCSMPSKDVSLYATLGMAKQDGIDEAALAELEKSYYKKREQVTAFVEDAVKSMVANKRRVDKIMTMKLSKYSEHECHANVMKAFAPCVGSLGSSTYALKFSSTFANLCQFVKDDAAIVKYLNEKCHNGPLFENVI